MTITIVNCFVLLDIRLPGTAIRILVVAGAAAAQVESAVIFHTFPQAINPLITGLTYYHCVNVWFVFPFFSIPEVVVSKFRTQAPWEFLLSASHTTLQSFELSRLAHASNLRKEITELLDQWLEENTSAMLARWLIEQHERSVLATDPSLEAESVMREGENASDNVLVDRTPLPRTPRNRS